MMLKIVPSLLLWASLMPGLSTALPAMAGTETTASEKAEVELYVSEGCPHCEAANAFVEGLERSRHDLHVTVIDVRRDSRALARLKALWRAAGITQPGVPTIHVGSRLIVGFDTPATTGARILQVLGTASAAAPAASADGICAVEETLSCDAPQEEAIEIPFTGYKLTVETVGLPLFTIAIGLLDGFNPCSMWVLILMISVLASLRDRRRMLAIAGTFVLIEGIAYFAFMAAWLNLFLLIGLSHASLMVIGVLAIIAGIINLKDFLAFGRGFTLSIPASAKPGIYARLRAILHTGKLWPAMFGTAVLAVLVQLVELLCTSGFPALYTRILTLRQLDQTSYYAYLLLYNAMYMLDDVIVLGIGVVTLSQRRLQEKEGRVLKLVAGVVMVGLGIYLLAQY